MAEGEVGPGVVFHASRSGRSPAPRCSSGGLCLSHGEALDQADVEARVRCFRLELPQCDEDEARACLALHDWNLQRAVPAAQKAEEAAHVVKLRAARAGGWLPGDEYVQEYERELARCRSAEAGAEGDAPIRGDPASADAARNEGQTAIGARAGGEEKVDAQLGAERVELRLRVRKDGAEAEEILQVRPDVVDLRAHTGLVELPVEVRVCAGSVRELAVQSHELEALPAWIGELTALTALRVVGANYLERECPLRELPDAMGQLTMLRTLELRGCRKLTALPAALGWVPVRQPQTVLPRGPRNAGWSLYRPVTPPGRHSLKKSPVKRNTFGG